MSIPSTPQSPAETPSCFRHPGRPTYVRCIRCERYICPECMREAAVGHQCLECARAGVRSVRQPRTMFGGRERSRTPVLTYALIAVNVGAFMLQMASVKIERQLILWPPAVANGELYRLGTSAFMHYGVTHLLLNMWALYVVAPPLEMWLGRLRFGALYALSALGGSVLVYLLSPLNTATAGASGAVFGLFGATFVVARTARFGRPLGGRADRDQLGLHVRRPGDHVAADQLAGAHRRVGDRCAGRWGLRVRAPRTPKPDPGRRDHRVRASIHAADLVAHKRSPRCLRIGPKDGVQHRSLSQRARSSLRAG